MHIVSPHWLNIIYILAFVYCHFQPSLMARAYNWGASVEGDNQILFFIIVNGMGQGSKLNKTLLS